MFPIYKQWWQGQWARNGRYCQKHPPKRYKKDIQQNDWLEQVYRHKVIRVSSGKVCMKLPETLGKKEF